MGGQTALDNNFIMVWPDGMHDNPKGVGSWNVSTTFGPKGRICPSWWWGMKRFECFYSCPLCDEAFSCDWTSCHDDIGFIDFVRQELTEKWCVDLDQMHL